MAFLFGKGMWCKTKTAIMRLSDERIKALQVLLKEETGKDYSNEESQSVALAIVRLIVLKLKNIQRTN
jgi:hypothetical protein